MQMLENIWRHPLALAAGLAALLIGPWLLRKAGLLTLVLLSLGVSTVVHRMLVGEGWVPNGMIYLAVTCAISVLLAVLLARHPVVAADAECLAVLVLCFAAGREIAGCLHWPQPLVWALTLGGTLVAPAVTIAIFATTFLSLSLGLQTPTATTLMFLVCLAILRLQCGRWTRVYWDPQLVRDLHTAQRASGRSAIPGARSERSVSVVFECASHVKQRLLIAQLKRMGIGVEQFPDDLAGADVPVKLLKAWRSPVGGLVRLQPDCAYSGMRTVTCPPVAFSTGAGVSLEEAARRLRTIGEQVLPDGVATGEGITVAVLDTGVNPVNAALEAALTERVSFVSSEPGPDDCAGHGSSVGACVVAVAPQVKLVSVKVLDGEGRGTLFSVLRGIQFVATNRHRIQVANLSLGHPGGDPGCLLCRSLAALERLGVASCTAIGNSGEHGAGSVECPGVSASTLGVAAVDIEGRVAKFSSRGPCRDSSIEKPDVSAFGVNLVLPDHSGTNRIVSGTSFACPLATGALAGSIQLLGKKNATVPGAYELLRRSCVPASAGSRDPDVTGRGIVNLLSVAQSLGFQDIVSGRSRQARPVRLAIGVPAVAAAAVIAIAGSWFALDHVGSVPRNGCDPGPILLLGRVRSGSAANSPLLFDDGTGVAELKWSAHDGTVPEPGTVILLRARPSVLGDGHFVLCGQSRFRALPF